MFVQGREIVFSSEYGEVVVDTLHLAIPAAPFMEKLFSNSEQSSVNIPSETDGHSLAELLAKSFLLIVIIVVGIIAIYFILMVIFSMLQRQNDRVEKHLKSFWYCLIAMSIAIVIHVLFWGPNRQELSIGVIGSVIGAAIYEYIGRVFKNDREKQ